MLEVEEARLFPIFVLCSKGDPAKTREPATPRKAPETFSIPGSSSFCRTRDLSPYKVPKDTMSHLINYFAPLIAFQPEELTGLLRKDEDRKLTRAWLPAEALVCFVECLESVDVACSALASRALLEQIGLLSRRSSSTT